MNRKGSLGFIFVTLLIDVLGFGLLIPVLPGFISSLSHQGISGASRDYGLLLSLYGAMQFIFAPVLGSLSDRFGRRPVLLLALFFTGIDYLIMANAHALGWLYVGRVLSGITGASFTAASAYIADISPPEKRSQNFGILGAAFGIGFIIGPAAGGLLGQFGARVPFWAAAILSLINLIYGFFVLPESLSEENRREFSIKEANPVGSLVMLAKYPVVWAMTASLAASTLAGQFLQSTWVLFMTYRFSWSTRETGLSLTAIGLLAVVVQMGLGRLMLPKLGDRKVIVIGLTACVVEFVGYALVTHGWMVYIVMVVASLSFLTGQATQGLLSRQVREDEQGSLQGALTSLSSITGIVGPLLATFIFSWFTRPILEHKIPGAAFLTAAGIDLIALIIAVRVLLKIPDHIGNPIKQDILID